MFKKIISGGQTGVDRAALDVAIKLNIPCGGWCPKGRLAEDGTLPEHYPLKETPTKSYPQRTEWNVRDSDGTLIFTWGKPTGGTAQTVKFAKSLLKPCLVVDMEGSLIREDVLNWAKTNKIGVVNVAGPRESKHTGAYIEVYKFISKLI